MTDPKIQKSEDDDREDELDEATEANTELDEAFNDDAPTEVPARRRRSGDPCKPRLAARLAIRLKLTRSQPRSGSVPESRRGLA